MKFTTEKEAVEMGLEILRELAPLIYDVLPDHIKIKIYTLASALVIAAQISYVSILILIFN